MYETIFFFSVDYYLFKNLKQVGDVKTDPRFAKF